MLVDEVVVRNTLGLIGPDAGFECSLVPPGPRWFQGKSKAPYDLMQLDFAAAFEHVQTWSRGLSLRRCFAFCVGAAGCLWSPQGSGLGPALPMLSLRFGQLFCYVDALNWALRKLSNAARLLRTRWSSSHRRRWLRYLQRWAKAGGSFIDRHQAGIDHGFMWIVSYEHQCLFVGSVWCVVEERGISEMMRHRLP